MSNRNLDTEDEWEKTELAMASLQLNIPEAPQLITPSEDETIDPALLNALNNSRERMILFQIEDTILRFVKSGGPQFELPTGLNSFRRLLTYRLGQRFNLTHVITDMNNENGEKLITLYRTPNTAIPRVLLIDYNNNHQLQFSQQLQQQHLSTSNTPTPQFPRSEQLSPVDNTNATAFFGGNGAKESITNPTSRDATPPISGNADGSNKKVTMVMKRNPSSSNPNNSKGGDNKDKPQLSAEEREKAYLEARARIFGEENAVSADTTSQSTSEKAANNTSSTNRANSSSPAFTTANAAAENNATNENNLAQTLLNRNEKKAAGGTIGKSLSGTSLNSQQSNYSRSSTNNDQDETYSSNNAVATSGSFKRVNSNPQVNNQNYEEQGGLRRNNSRGGVNEREAGERGGAGGSRKGNKVDVGSWKENKSQLKNTEAEKADPDFVRRSSPNIANTANNGSNANYDIGYAPYDYSRSSPQQQSGGYYGGGYDNARSPCELPPAAPSVAYSNVGYPGYGQQQYNMSNLYPPAAYGYINTNDPNAMLYQQQYQWQQQQQRGSGSPYSRNNQMQQQQGYYYNQGGYDDNGYNNYYGGDYYSYRSSLGNNNPSRGRAPNPNNNQDFPPLT